MAYGTIMLLQSIAQLETRNGIEGFVMKDKIVDLELFKTFGMLGPLACFDVLGPIMTKIKALRLNRVDIAFMCALIYFEVLKRFTVPYQKPCVLGTVI